MLVYQGIIWKATRVSNSEFGGPKFGLVTNFVQRFAVVLVVVDKD